MTLEDYDMFKQYHWKSSFYFRDGNMFVQHDVVMQWSSISGSRPGKCGDTFESDIPKYVSVDDTPKTVCWEDIELFFLRDPQSSRDVLCAIINFRKTGRKAGRTGRFFMHWDSQLAYCPILRIVALAFRDNAFENERLTPNLLWRLRVPSRLPNRPIPWKKEIQGFAPMSLPGAYRARQAAAEDENHEEGLLYYETMLAMEIDK
ncbi:hypothetical protein BU26DRAFT_571555 [Trematosphaeria pertusa]|uniref:Uncharacterized protein n=1 Tax=Trematosphaeria pertusa TaxID=390896 RepID=A0A6A6HWQ1_9PLEO|nr:uncharacterized protein BU26DRAFT_571555 [Trematosphaeria pertusa]KAF2241810.1 hypothetical protein BU26DRAFT_571555 [Trematosphaeria pertusa]